VNTRRNQSDERTATVHYAIRRSDAEHLAARYADRRRQDATPGLDPGGVVSRRATDRRTLSSINRGTDIKHQPRQDSHRAECGLTGFSTSPSRAARGRKLGATEGQTASPFRPLRP
jgi:hypothetical protein